MLDILPTTQNIAELEYVHHEIARLTRQYPINVSSGRATPSKLAKTRGRRQYPRTELDRPRVRVEEKCEEPWYWLALWFWMAATSSDDRGGDIMLKTKWRLKAPRAASPQT